jgi:hypothetical protein
LNASISPVLLLDQPAVFRTFPPPEKSVSSA